MEKSSKSCLFLVLLIVGSVLLSGCVRRRMTVRSNPPGATVYLDGKEIGRTPFSTNFDFYGNREFRLVKEGYETKTLIMPVRAPWYQWIGLDFVSEVFLPGKLTDHKYYEFDMLPDRIIPNRELVDRGEELRRKAHAEGTLRVTDGGYVSVQNNPQGGSLVPSQDGSPGATVYQPPVTTPNPNAYVAPELPLFGPMPNAEPTTLNQQATPFSTLPTTAPPTQQNPNTYLPPQF